MMKRFFLAIIAGIFISCSQVEQNKIIDQETLSKLKSNNQSLLNKDHVKILTFSKSEIDEFMNGYEVEFSIEQNDSIINYRESFTEDYKLHRSQRLK